jgi:hypothetical protein
MRLVPLAAWAGSARPSFSLSLPVMPPLIYWNESALDATRALIAAGDASVAPAMAALLAEADRSLRDGPWTVTRQTGAGPAGATRSSYVSIGPYWWPCGCSDPPDGAGCAQPPPPTGAPPATGTCNATTGLPWVQHDGVFNTRAIALFLARSEWGSFSAALTNLTLAYALTGVEAYAERAAEWARVFFVDGATAMLPNLDHAQFIPGRTDGRGIGVIDFSQYCALGFLDGLSVLRASPSWSAADDAAVRAWFTDFLAWLLTSPVALEEAATVNNHLTFYRALVQAVALFVGDAATARASAAAAGAGVLDPQIDAAGAMPLEEARTRSLHYVAFNLHAAQSLATTARRAGVDLWGHVNATNARGSIAAAVSYMAPFATGAAPWPHEQIDEFLMGELWDVFVLAARAYPPHEAAFAAAAASLLQPPAATDFRRLLWPAPAAGGPAASPPGGVGALAAALAGAGAGAAGVALAGGALLLRARARRRLQRRRASSAAPPRDGEGVALLLAPHR